MRMKTTLKLLACAIGVAGMMTAAGVPQAAEIEKIHFLIPGGAGGGWDGTARCTGEALTKAGIVGTATYENMSGGGGGKADQATLDKVDVYFRFGSAPGPFGLPDMALDDEYITYAAQPEFNSSFKMKRSGRRGHGAALPDRMVTFADIMEGTNRGRSSAAQITYSERGNIQGAQFWAVGGVVYEKAKAAGLGHEVPTEWFLQDIRD